MEIMEWKIFKTLRQGKEIKVWMKFQVKFQVFLNPHIGHKYCKERGGSEGSEGSIRLSEIV